MDEFHRLVRRQARSIADFLPRTLFRYELALEDVLDLRTLAALDAVGLSLDHVRSDDLEAVGVDRDCGRAESVVICLAKAATVSCV